MTIRVRSQILLVAALDADEKQCQFVRDDKTLNTINETFDAENSGQVVLAAAEADYALPMGKVATGKVLYIETDTELVVKLDGEVTGHSLGAPTSGTKAKLYLRSSFASAPVITNADATNEATVNFFIAGDA